MARTKRGNHASTPMLILNREEFDCNTMSGRWIERWHNGTGELSDDEAYMFHEHHDGPMYVVYSFETPIAWWTEANGWYRVNQKISPATSKHQGRLYLV